MREPTQTPFGLPRDIGSYRHFLENSWVKNIPVQEVIQHTDGTNMYDYLLQLCLRKPWDHPLGYGPSDYNAMTVS